MSFEPNLGTTGAKRTSWSENNPRKLVAALLKRYPDDTKEQALERFLDIARENEAMIETALTYFHANAWQALTRKERSPSEKEARRKETEAAVAAAKAKVTDAIEAKAKLLLLDLIMPNEKRLAECTGFECIKFGGWLGAVGKAAGKQLVGKALTEQQVRSFWEKRA